MLIATVGSIITKLFNMSIKSGKLPNERKLAHVTPIPIHVNKSDPANYSPISLLCILCKFLEKHILIHYPKHLQKQSHISNSQWDFTKGKVTTGALLKAVQSCHQILENGADVCAIFLILKRHLTVFLMCP